VKEHCEEGESSRASPPPLDALERSPAPPAAYPLAVATDGHLTLSVSFNNPYMLHGVSRVFFGLLVTYPMAFSQLGGG
jgi:hypothetical protein